VVFTLFDYLVLLASVAQSASIYTFLPAENERRSAVTKCIFVVLCAFQTHKLCLIPNWKANSIPKTKAIVEENTQKGRKMKEMEGKADGKSMETV